jgi:hypothetical protein
LWKLADAGQLFAEHHIQHAGSANLRLHQHHAGVFGNHLSDDGGIAAKLMLLHLPKHGFAISGATMASSLPSLAT